MSAFRRIMVFFVLVLLFSFAVWRPWEGFFPQIRGLSPGVDVTSHKFVFLEIETSIVTFRSNENNLEKVWDRISRRLSDYWGSSLISIDKENRIMVFEIGSFITSRQLEPLLPDGEILEIRTGKSEKLADEIVEIFEHRLDPYNLRGDRIRKVGENMILVETGAEIKPELMTTKGRIEMFIDEDLATTPADILGFGKASEEDGVGLIPIYFTEDGRSKFNSIVIGKQYSFILFFVDRPHDGILIFDPQDLLDLEEFFFDNERNRFVENASRVAINVVSFPSSKDSMSDDLANYLVGHFGEKVRVLLLGSPEEFSAEFLGRIPSSYRIEFIERENESVDKWLKRALGFLISVPVGASLAENGVAEGAGINLPFPTGMSKAVEFRHILLNPLPATVKLSTSGIVKGDEILSSNRYFLICSIPLLVFSAILFFLSRSIKTTVVFMVFDFSMLIILFGLFSLLGLYLTFTSVIVGVVLTSFLVACSLQVTFEMLGGFKPVEGVQIGWRRGKALSQVYLWFAILLLVLIVLSLSNLRIFLPLSISSILWLVILVVFGLPTFVSMLERSAVSKKEKV